MKRIKLTLTDSQFQRLLDRHTNAQDKASRIGGQCLQEIGRRYGGNVKSFVRANGGVYGVTVNSIAVLAMEYERLAKITIH